MKVLIIEDEAPAFRRLQTSLENIDDQIEIIDVIDSVEASVKYLQNHQKPDLIFMDIQLSDGISFEIFEQIDILTPVIFTTAFDEYMLRAFKVNSIDYLLKPIKRDDLVESIAKFKKLHNGKTARDQGPLNELIRQIRLDDKKYKTRFLVRKGEELYSVETREISCFRTHLGVVHLHTTDRRTFLMDQSLEEILQQLSPEDFYRANRQFIVHYPAIAKVHRYHKGKLLLELNSPIEDQIFISAEKASDFKSWLNQ